MSTFNLDLQLAALRDAVAQEAPPASVDRAIAARIAAAATPNDRAAGKAARLADAWRGDHWLLWPLGLAASMVALSFIVRNLPPSTEAAEPRMAAAAAADAQARRAFVPVVPMAELERAGDKMVIPARLARMTLAQLGLPVDPARAGEGVDTELLVRGDGSVLAVRFIY